MHISPVCSVYIMMYVAKFSRCWCTYTVYKCTLLHSAELRLVLPSLQCGCSSDPMYCRLCVWVCAYTQATDEPLSTNPRPSHNDHVHAETGKLGSSDTLEAMIPSSNGIAHMYRHNKMCY